MRCRNLLPALALVAAACGGGNAAVTTTQETPNPPTSGGGGNADVTTTQETPNPPTSAGVDGLSIPPATGAMIRNQLGFEFPTAPTVPEGPADESLVAEINTLFSNLSSELDLIALRRIGESGDARAAWLLSDLLQFIGPSEAQDIALDGFEQLTGATLRAH